ncbi:hypothetical protein N656DRAFT_843563 [Canariomyces notabilis]|uniref:Mediator of RNA polymerase II transcription subunit 11 n=1 Tax=Canariomyces notabilis TaxID=2074819 RepID=A0AAN6TI15_9PEZI|nr:hypothetical protein N656DRAFT_843563 [Canariomyces arenarius]
MNDSAQPPQFSGAGLSGGPAVDIHQPFTPAERIEQLSQVDNDIASLLNHLSSAIRALATPPSAAGSDNDGSGDVLILDSSPGAAPPSSSPLTSFRAAQAAFFQTVDRIDKQLTRQIFALEEAGIITLRGNTTNIGDQQQTQQQQGQGQQQQQQSGEAADGAAAVAARLEPNGIGRYGKLDVGQLNMASSTVERDFEAELWRRAREHLERVVKEEEDRMKE